MNGLFPHSWLGLAGDGCRILVYAIVAILAIGSMSAPKRHLALLFLTGSVAGILSTAMTVYQHVHLLNYGVVRYGPAMVGLAAAGHLLSYLQTVAWAVGMILVLQERSKGATQPPVP